MDPEGVNLPKKHQLSRRIYVNKGPNYLIHIDGYDKLKAYGFAIHGGICGYSRRILWFRVGRTNNDPEVVAGYFLEYLLGIEGVPRCIRADKGTGNKIIENIQKSLRWYHGDDMAGEKSFLYGPSAANQRIERFWRSAKQGGCQFWIDLFKDLEASGDINTENGQNKCVYIISTFLDPYTVMWTCVVIIVTTTLASDDMCGYFDMILDDEKRVVLLPQNTVWK
ncbi:hypothetical protein SNE40_002667 [Patella caerulea]|uniref:Integrase core domain-containing protein n=1 Tax=Patella caerulea TaxID=87958 RepID=A0AAN8K6K3_PATCE